MGNQSELNYKKLSCGCSKPVTLRLWWAHFLNVMTDLPTNMLDYLKCLTIFISVFNTHDVLAFFSLLYSVHMYLRISAFCMAGEKYVPPPADMCVNCTRGEYHPNAFDTRTPSEQTMCLSCGAGMTTIYPGSENQNQCVSK